MTDATRDPAASRIREPLGGDAPRASALELIDAALATNATELTLRNRGLRELPPELSEARELRVLDLSGNRLTRIPDAVFALAQLERLDLGNNRLTALDPRLANLAALRVLDVSENRLDALPDAFGVALRELSAYGNRIGSVPIAIVALPSLEVLDLARNGLERLPSFAGRLERLRTLDVSDNRLSALPEGIGGLVQLVSLDVSRNRLTSVAELAALPALEELVLDDNRLTQIPESLARLPALRVLSAKRNAFGALPDAFNRVAGALVRSVVSDVVRKRVRGGPEAGTRYFDAPTYQIGSALRVAGSVAVGKIIDLYHKGAYANCAVSLQYPDGSFVALGDITRKTALTMTADHAAELQSQPAVVRFPGAARPADIDGAVALSEDAVSRVAGVDVIDETTGAILVPAVARSARPGDAEGAAAAPAAEAPSAPLAPAASLPAHVDVELSAQAPSEVAVGDEVVIDLLVAIAGRVSALLYRAQPGIVPVAPSEKIVALASVVGDAVTLDGPRIVRLDVPTDAAPASSNAFIVRGVREGTARIAILFRQGGSELGSIVLPLRAVSGSAARDRFAAQTVVAAPRDPADDSIVLLLVTMRDDGSGYKFTLSSDDFQWDYVVFDSPPLLDGGGGGAATALRYVQGLSARLTDRVLRNYTDVNEFGTEVRAAGVDLARQLFPTDLIRALWEKRDRLRVHVKSWEASIPWEIARLRHPDSKVIDDRFLAEYDLVRSFNGMTRPNAMPLERWRYLVAEYPNNAQLPLTQEKRVFTDTLAALGIQAAPVNGTPAAVYELLREANFDVLHVCCHGEADANDIENSRLIIGDRLVDGKPANVTIVPATVSTEANFTDHHPLVFLNACDSGHVGASLSALGGWPKAFWDAGAGAFVGTSWPVRDVPARKFCAAFYERFLAGDSLALAAGAARAAAKTSGDATWLAYKVYGNPSSRKQTPPTQNIAPAP